MEKNKIVQIIPLVKLKRDMNLFDYKIPSKLCSQIKKGQLVEIPFRNKNIQGIVFNFTNIAGSNYKLKSLNKIIDPVPFLNQWQLKLISYLGSYYYISMSVFTKMVIPKIPKRKTNTRNKFLDKIYFNTKFKPLDIKYSIKTKPNLIHYNNYENKISVYLDLIKKTIKTNKQIVIILPQLHDVAKLYTYLSDYQKITSVLLNDLPKGLYWQEWVKIKKSESKIIIGTRSAIFAPFKNLNTIVIDQEDDFNHKQEEPNPRYSTHVVALKIHELLKCKIIFTSNSPSIKSLKLVHDKKWHYNLLDKTVKFPVIKIIDKKDELRKQNYSIFSEELINKIEYNLKRVRKIFLFINRKGAATLATCKDCGFIPTCPTCKLPLTYHVSKKFVCHHCSYQKNLFLVCPSCKSANIKFTGIGTESVEEAIKFRFPHVKALKLDKETPYTKQDLEKYEVYIGTSYAFNYLNWSDINLIGVINADTLLYLPDYKSSENTFNLINKLISGISNSKNENEIIIQTFTPENNIFKSIKEVDYKKYYINEIKQRKMFKYPPFTKLIKLIYQSREFNYGQNEVNKLYNEFRKNYISDYIDINKPVLSYTRQVRGNWRWQIVIKILDEKASLDWLYNLPENIIIDVDPAKLI